MAVPSIPAGVAVWFPDCKMSVLTGWWSREILVSARNWLMEVQNQQCLCFHCQLCFICIFVSFLTVVLALRKPMKIVSRISPIEATRYLDETPETQKQGRRKGRKDVTVFLHGNGKCDRQSEKNHCYDSHTWGFPVYCL